MQSPTRVAALGLLLAAGCTGSAVAPVAREPAIVPAPRWLVQTPGTFLLRPSTTIVAPGSLRAEADLAASVFGAPERPLRVSATGSGIVLALDPAQVPHPEGYVLDVDRGGARIVASTPTGVTHGIYTLVQLLDANADPGAARALPWVHIEDEPRFAHRGVLLDEARYFMGAEAVRSLIDQAAELRMNVLHWHLTDDQGWRLEIPSLPRLIEVGSRRAGSHAGDWFGETDAVDPTPHEGFYTREELVALAEYAAARHITIIPEIDLPGHSTAAIAAYPELGCTGEPREVTPLIDTHEDVLCVCRESVMEVLEQILDEVIAIFDPPVVHLGGDEVDTTQWEESAECERRIVELGLADADDLRLYTVRRLSAFLEARGRRTVVWGDPRSSELPAQVVVQHWRGPPTDVVAFAESGHEIVMSPFEAYYLNRNLERIPLAMTYGTPVIPAELDAAQAARVIGLEGCLWTPWIRTPVELEGFAYPRLAAIAELGWRRPESLDYEDFLRRMPRTLERWDADGLAHAGPEALR